MAHPRLTTGNDFGPQVLESLSTTQFSLPAVPENNKFENASHYGSVQTQLIIHETRAGLQKESKAAGSDDEESSRKKKYSFTGVLLSKTPYGDENRFSSLCFKLLRPSSNSEDKNEKCASTQIPANSFLEISFYPNSNKLVGYLEKSYSAKLDKPLYVIFKNTDIGALLNLETPLISTVRPQFKVLSSHSHHKVRYQTIKTWENTPFDETLVTGERYYVKREKEIQFTPSFFTPDASQAAVISEFNSMKEGLMMFQGPPGTGKSKTIGALLESALENREDIYLISETNKSVEVLLKIARKIFPAIPIAYFVSTKHNEKINPDFSDYTPQGKIKKQIDLLDEVLAEWKKLDENAKTQEEKEALPIKRQEEPLHRLSQELDRRYQPVAQLMSDFFSGEIETDGFIDLINQLKEKINSIGYLNFIKTELSESLIKCGTINSISVSVLKSIKPGATFIIDEATQATEDQLLPILRIAGKVVLVGDPFQLPPFLSDEARRKNHRSLMQRLYDVDYPCGFLNKCYRVEDASLMRFLNQAVYDNRIQFSAEQKALAEAKKEKNALPVFALINVPAKKLAGNEEKKPGETSFFNTTEINLVEELVDRLVSHSKNIAVISPYRAQIRELQKRLGDKVTVISSVDAMQGDQAEIVILSCVRSNSRGEKGFITNFNRMVVAASRAEKRFFVVGDGPFLANQCLNENSDDLMAGYVEYCIENDVYYSWPLFKEQFFIQESETPTADDRIGEVQKAALSRENEIEEKAVPLIEDLKLAQLNQRQRYDLVCAEVNCHLKKRNYKEAAELIEGLENHRENGFLCLLLANVYYSIGELGSLKKAELIVLELKEKQNNPRYLILLAKIYKKQGYFKRALDLLDEAVDLLPPHKKWNSLREKISCYIQAENFSEAIRLGRRLVVTLAETKNKGLFYIVYELIFAYFHVRKYDRITELLNEYPVPSDHPVSGKIKLLQKKILSDQGENPAFADSDDFDSLFDQLLVLKTNLRFFEAIKIGERLLEKKLSAAHKEKVLLELMRAYSEIGNFNKIESIFNQDFPEIKQFSVGRCFDIELFYARYLLNKGEIEEGASYLETLYSYYGDHPKNCAKIFLLMLQFKIPVERERVHRLSQASPDQSPCYQEVLLQFELSVGRVSDNPLLKDTFLSLKQLEVVISAEIKRAGRSALADPERINFEKLTDNIDLRSRKGVYLKAHLLSLGDASAIEKSISLCNEHVQTYPELNSILANIYFKKDKLSLSLECLVKAIDNDIFYKNIPFRFLSLLQQNHSLWDTNYVPRILKILTLYPEESELHYLGYSVLLHFYCDISQIKEFYGVLINSWNGEEKNRFLDLFVKYGIVFVENYSEGDEAKVFPEPIISSTLFLDNDSSCLTQNGKPVLEFESKAEVDTFSIKSPFLILFAQLLVGSSGGQRKIGVLGGYNIDRFLRNHDSNDIDFHTSIDSSEVMAFLFSHGFSPRLSPEDKTPVQGTKHVFCYVSKEIYGVTSIDVTCHPEAIPEQLGSHDHDALFLELDETGTLKIPEDRKAQAIRCFDALQQRVPSQKISGKSYIEDPMQLWTALFGCWGKLEEKTDRELRAAITYFIQKPDELSASYRSRLLKKFYRKMLKKNNNSVMMFYDRLIEYRALELFWPGLCLKLENLSFRYFLLQELYCIQDKNDYNSVSQVALIFEFVNLSGSKNLIALTQRIESLRLPLFAKTLDFFDLASEVRCLYTQFERAFVGYTSKINSLRNCLPRELMAIQAAAEKKEREENNVSPKNQGVSSNPSSLFASKRKGKKGKPAAKAVVQRLGRR